jgi:uncharacterized Fe-S cluster protein YjdI
MSNGAHAEDVHEGDGNVTFLFVSPWISPQSGFYSPNSSMHSTPPSSTVAQMVVA